MTVKTKAVTVLGDKLKSISQKVIEDEKNQGIKKKADKLKKTRIESKERKAKLSRALEKGVSDLLVDIESILKEAAIRGKRSADDILVRWCDFSVPPRSMIMSMPAILRLEKYCRKNKLQLRIAIELWNKGRAEEPLNEYHIYASIQW